MVLYYFKALVLGMIIALPFGPVGFLCLHRAVAGGVLAGLVSGVGAALADAFYGAIAAFGLKVLSDFLTSHHYLLQFLGGLFLLYMGGRLLLRGRNPGSESALSHTIEDSRARTKLDGSFVSTFFLAAANPMTIIAFLAFFAGFGLGGTQTHYGHALAVVLGVFSGSMVWWVAIAVGGGRLKERVLSRMPLLETVCGGIVLAFGIWAVVEAGVVMLK